MVRVLEVPEVLVRFENAEVLERFKKALQKPEKKKKRAKERLSLP